MSAKSINTDAERAVKRMFGMNPDNQAYIFHRGDMWYPIELPDDSHVLANVKLNPGTTKVENAFTKQVIWEQKP